MPLYKFKVYLEDDEEVFRIIELKPGQTFLHFHDVILKAFAFDDVHDASFHMSDDNWRKGVEISKEKKAEIAHMKDAKLNSKINDPHQKIIFIYRQPDIDWFFNCELNGIIMNVDVATDYPNIAKSVGKPPKQYKLGNTAVGENLEEDEFEYLTRNLLAGDVSDEEMKEHSGFSDEENESEDDESDTTSEDYDGDDNYDDED